MKVRVLLFASFAEIARWRDREIEVEAPVEGEAPTVGDVLAVLRRRWLQVLPASARPLVSRNRVHVALDEPIAEGDEIAVFPPVSGGEDDRAVVTAEPLDVAALADAVRHPSCGALAVFEGIVREENEGSSVVAIEYEAYAEMAVEVLRAIAREVELGTPRCRVALAHRTGRLEVGQTSVAVAVAAPHRREAFAACRLAMDRIKESLPVWKKEETTGEHRWVTP